MASAPAASGHFNELDPHGAEAGHHGHVIIGVTQLRLVLGALLLFTALTVGIAQLEVWVQAEFDILLPKWVNIVVAMSIATVKSLLVLAIFMQLRYDNPINSIIVAFSLLGVALFLGFTSLDLLTRDRVYEFKAGQVVAGGTGSGVEGTDGKPLVVAARDRYIEKLTEKLGTKEAAEAAFAKKLAEKHAAHGHHGKDHPTHSTANQSRPRAGVTGALSTAPTVDGHGDGHGAEGKEKAGEAGGH